MTPKNTAEKQEKQEKFEVLLKRLEGLVERLEAGQTPLDETLAAFKEAMGLSKKLEGILERGRAAVMELSQDGGLKPSSQADLQQDLQGDGPDD